MSLRGRVIPVLFCIALTAAPSAGDREAAQWAIRQGGRVMVNGGEPIGDIGKLPAGDFRVTGVDLFGAPVTPKELEDLHSGGVDGSDHHSYFTALFYGPILRPYFRALFRRGHARLTV